MEYSHNMVRERNFKPVTNGVHSNDMTVKNELTCEKYTDGHACSHSNEHNNVHNNTNDHDNMQLLSSNALPHFLADNEYLLHHHRPQIQSITGCVKSAFNWHTETINIWSHFIGSVGSFIIMLHHYTHSEVDFKDSVWLLPFFLGATTCMGCSAIYHTFLCYSESVYKCLGKIDYCGIIMLIVSSFPPWLHFGFYCDAWTRNVYLVLIYSIGSVCAFVILNDGLGKKGKHFRTIRAALFMTLGLSGLFPGLHYFYVDGYDMMVRFGSWLIIMALWYLAGGTIYALRIPEKLSPGKFDVLMHSHQFLHMFVIMGVVSCFIGITRLAEYRRHTNYYCPRDF